MKTPRLKISLLGSPRIEIDGAAPRLQTRKSLALLIYLVYTRESHRRDSLVNLLWPESGQVKGRAQLRGAVYSLRTALGRNWLEADRETLALAFEDDVWVDANRFQNLISQCRSHGHRIEQVCSECLAPLSEAADLYRGDFLEGFSLKDSANFDNWQLSQSYSLRSDAEFVFDRLIQCLSTGNNYGQAIRYAQRWLELDHANEKFHRQLMELYARSGQRTAALRQYEECEQRLSRELGVEPDTATIELYRNIKNDRIHAAQPVAPAAAIEPAHNLPNQITSFVGRKGELVEVQKLLRTTCLLTLTGSGGCGKTRLALEVASRVLENYQDGVWLVELGSLTDQARLPQSVASALGVREQREYSITDMLLNYLRSKHMLVILDNCEHLIQSCAGLVEKILSRCKRLNILVTSREPLKIAGEVTWRVPSLATPDPGDIKRLARSELIGYESVHLFADRAGAILSAFQTNEDNLRTAGQICCRLDGIPLAIELVTAKLRVLSIAQILARLDGHFRLLTGGSRTSLPRHQTLKGTTDWSYKLLLPKERSLLCRLSVFAGTFGLDASEAVCCDPIGTGRIQKHEILDILGNLIDKSMVIMEARKNKRRYRLLETIRLYGEEKLQGLSEQSRFCERHRDWYLRLAERAGQDLRGHGQLEWFGQLEIEKENISRAIEWSLANKGEEAVLKFGGALWWFWLVRGYYSEGCECQEKALDGSTDSIFLRVKGIFTVGLLSWVIGHMDKALAYGKESLSLYRRLGDKKGMNRARMVIGLAYGGQGSPKQARKQYRQSLKLSRQIGDR